MLLDWIRRNPRLKQRLDDLASELTPPREDSESEQHTDYISRLEQRLDDITRKLTALREDESKQHADYTSRLEQRLEQRFDDIAREVTAFREGQSKQREEDLQRTRDSLLEGALLQTFVVFGAIGALFVYLFSEDATILEVVLIFAIEIVLSIVFWIALYRRRKQSGGFLKWGAAVWAVFWLGWGAPFAVHFWVKPPSEPKPNKPSKNPSSPTGTPSAPFGTTGMAATAVAVQMALIVCVGLGWPGLDVVRNSSQDPTPTATPTIAPTKTEIPLLTETLTPEIPTPTPNGMATLGPNPEYEFSPTPEEPPNPELTVDLPTLTRDDFNAYCHLFSGDFTATTLEGAIGASSDKWACLDSQGHAYQITDYVDVCSVTHLDYYITGAQSNGSDPNSWICRGQGQP